MEFEIFRKNKDKYEKRLFIVPSGAGFAYFKSLNMTVDNELENIRNDIINTYPKGDMVNLKRPVHENNKVNDKLSKLIEIRKNNIQIKTKITLLLSETEFIICEHCKHKMYKTPLDVSLEKYGSQYLFISDIKISNPIYVYLCSNCIHATQEALYEQEQARIKLKNDLIKDGYNFVPNKFGAWNKLDDRKPMKKPPWLRDEEDDCVWERIIERIKIPKTNETFMKIIDVCRKCGKVKTIK